MIFSMIFIEGSGACAGGSKKDSQLTYQRHVPKFLQAHAHLLGKGAQHSEEPSLDTAPAAAQLRSISDDEDDQDHEVG